MKKVKLLSLFSGIGAFEKALDRIGQTYELVNYCDIDKYASRSYAAIHGVDESMNLWDITKVDTDNLPNDIDLITYGFPCQDISNSGKQRGFEHNGGRTRSGLFFEALRIPVTQREGQTDSEAPGGEKNERAKNQSSHLSNGQTSAC